MKHLMRIAGVSLALGLVAVPATAQEVTYDLDRTKNFSGVKSFALDTGTPSDNPLVDQRVAAAIAAELSARGMIQVDHDPDVRIIPSRTSEMRKESTAWNAGYWPYYGSWYGYVGWGPMTYEVRELQYDTIAIDMVDARTGALMWRGKSVKRVHSHWDAEDIDRKVHKTVAKIMGKLPAMASLSARVYR